jgi:hypothetical protein
VQNATQTLLLAAAAALVSAELSSEGDDARDALLQALSRALPSRTQSNAEIVSALIGAAMWDATPEQLAAAGEMRNAASALVAFDANPANARPTPLSMFEDEDPNEDIRREYEADLFSRADLERMNPSSYE